MWPGATSPAGDVPNLETGMRVKVKGRLEADGSFVALEVRIRPPAVKAKIKAAIEYADPDLALVRVLRRDIALSSLCQITDRSARPFSARELAAGDVVRLAGTYSAEEGFVARSVRVSRSGDMEELVGNIESLDRDRRSFDVLGFSVLLTDNTKLRIRAPDVTLGDPAHPFELPKLNLAGDGRATAGEIVQIPNKARNQPTVVLFGSYTCPLSRRFIAAVAELHECFQDRLAFFFVYIREAHPEPGRVLQENRKLGIAIREATSGTERTSVAGTCALRLGMRIPVLIDAIDNSVAELYQAWPARLYLIGADGRIAYASRRGRIPVDAEMMRVRTEREFDQLQAAIDRELAGPVR
jgi:thiol-disulfide isomerase/thioredoxin